MSIYNSIYEYKNCGCKFPANIEDGKVVALEFIPNIKNITLNCKITWDLLASGNCLGIFQLGSYLGKKYCELVKPDSISILSDICAIIRPGSIEALDDDGVSATDHYVKCRNGEESIQYLHPELEPILKNTYGILVYQEQGMKIAQELAGFSLVQADVLRSAAGKKDVEKMAKMKTLFMAGCEQIGKVNKQEAEEIFSGIEASQRYAFNKCLDPETKVTTPNGEKTLYELNIGDKVLGPTQNNNEFIEVLDIIDSGEKILYEIELESGHQIKCTLEHKFLCGDNQIHTLYEILENNLDIMVYQEPAQKIIRVKSIGKQKCLDIEVNSPEHLFYANGITTSNSHSVSYALNAYLSAYEKAHFPLAFFASRLEFCKTISEIEPYILNLREMGLQIVLPDIRLQNDKFIIKDRVIRWSLSKMKNVGTDAIKKIQETIIPNTWLGILVNLMTHISSSAVQSLIKGGALDWLELPRNRMYFEYKIFRNLTSSQQAWVRENYIDSDTLLEVLNACAALGTGKGKPSANVRSLTKLKRQIELLSSPPCSMYDSIDNIYSYEVAYLGAGISCNDIDNCNTSSATHTLENIKVQKPSKATVAGTITNCKEIKTKRGDNPGQLMAFLEMSDGFTGLDNIVVFPDQWGDYNHLLFEGNTIICKGSCNKGSFIVEKVWQAV